MHLQLLFAFQQSYDTSVAKFVFIHPVGRLQRLTVNEGGKRKRRGGGLRMETVAIIFIISVDATANGALWGINHPSV